MNAVELDQVTVLRGQTPVVGPVDFVLPRGERAVIAGQNGAGKTSLLLAVLGLLPARGRVLVFGMDVGGRSWRLRRSRVAYVNQGAVQVEFPISTDEVVGIGLIASGLGRRERSARIRTAMELTGSLALRGRSYARLSGGEKQRVSLARALAQRPDLLVLDEPTAALDPSAKEDLLEVLDGIPEISILMVTHEHTHLELSGWSTFHLYDGRLWREPAA